MKRRFLSTCLIVFLSASFSFNLQAQYFGRNKVQYENFDFKVEESPNFETYHYLDHKDCLHDLLNQTEQWYGMHQGVLKDTFQKKNPFLLYNNHPDFQQTNSISGSIGIGTGGVTEAFKNRVVLPIAMTNQQTNHVIGHELVHAFQYNMIINGDSTKLENLRNIPLWMVEGLAEYLSIGRVDPHTSMWMRDAVLNDDVPSLSDLDNMNKYFPYRWGQAFWAFFTSAVGDEYIEPFFMRTADVGLDMAILQMLGMKKDSFSNIWEKTLRNHYTPFLKDKKERRYGKTLLSEKNSGRMNLSPAVSPDGKYVIFYSEKDLFGIDLFLADAQNGEVIRKVTSTIKDSHYDEINFIESAGTWSPDSKQFAYVTVKKGDNFLAIKDVFTGKLKDNFRIKGVPAFTNPTWSPDGKTIVVTGLVDGQLDLYSVNVRSKKVVQLTDDKYTEIHPDWSLDGTQIVFATDKLSMENGRRAGKWTFNLAILDPVSGAKEDFDVFPTANNLNPVFDHRGDIYFLSDRDGYRNLYRFDIFENEVFQMTDLLTGISGITQYAPAISVSKSDKRDKIMLTHFKKGSYTVFAGRQDQFLNQKVDPIETNFAASTLPDYAKGVTNLLENSLAKMDEYEPLPSSAFAEKPYRPKFKLDYVGGGGGIGVGTNSVAGTTTGLAGGVDLLFGDILGDNQVFTNFALNGEIYDFGGQVTYLNRNNRINWGVTLAHIPYRTGSVGYGGLDTLQFRTGEPFLAERFVINNVRVFREQIGGIVQYPISQNLRIEAGANYSFFSNRVDRLDNYYDAFGRLVLQEREKIDPQAAGLNLFRGSLATTEAALVGDRSFSGLTSPLAGHRFRIGAEHYFGDFSFTNATVDLRKYFRLKPITLAVRGMHVGRYGRDADGFYPLYLGSPWYVRGLEYGDAQRLFPENGLSVSELFGSKIFVSNFEVRLPFTGPKQLSLISSKYLLTDLNLFVDGGMAFDDVPDFEGVRQNNSMYFATAGASVRVNLLGALIVEPYYAFPLMKETRGFFGLNIIPGW